jgi:hypothetical protein
MFEKVLVALDFSPYSQKLLDRVREIPGKIVVYDEGNKEMCLF